LLSVFIYKMPTVEERFQAAVNVIKGLPKNGPYQPSNEMMLKFYGYYKQATEGPCTQRKPPFWDIVGKAKWDAWASKKNFTKEEAMEKYVNELRQIIETMSFTENVQNFVGSIDGLDNINLDEIDLISPGLRELAESHPDSPFNSRTNSPNHNAYNIKDNLQANYTKAELNTNNNEEKPTANGYLPNGSNHYVPQASTTTNAASNATNVSAVTNGYSIDQSDDEYDDPIDMQHDFTEAMSRNSDLLKQIQTTIARMNADVLVIGQRMNVLEKNMGELRDVLKKSNSLNSALAKRYPRWWPFADISPTWFMFLILWPFLANRMTRLLSTSRRK